MAETREEVLSRNAQRFAKAYYDNAAMRGVPMLPDERKAFEEGEDAYINWMARAMYAKMAAEDEYSADNWNDAKAERLDAFKDIEGAAYAMAGGKSPEQKNYEKGWEKFRPLVENGEWYRLGPAAMTLKMTELGYDNSDEKSRNQFWEDLRKYDVDYNRALSVDEFANSGWGKVNAVVNRTAYKEAIGQALGERPDNPAAVLTGLGIDRGRDLLMAPAMAMGGFVKPVLTMGAADLYTQGAAAFGLNQPYSPGETLSSMGAGATVVPGLRYGTRWLSRTKNPKVAEFGRELNRGAKNYRERDYVAEEANALKQQLLQVRKEQQAMSRMQPGTPEYDAALSRLDEMESKLRLLGFNSTEPDVNNISKYIESISQNSFNNTARGTGVSIQTMLGTGNRTIPDEAAARQIDRALGSKWTFTVHRPELEDVAVRQAAKNLGLTQPEIDGFLVARKTDPVNYGGWPKEQVVQIERAAKNLMDEPSTVNYLDQILQNATERRAALNATFPKTSAKFNGATQPKGRTWQSALGSGISNALGLLSGSEGVDLVAAARAAGTIGDDRSVFQDKIDAFKQSDWYRNLPEDRKNVLEAAFKKAAEERKKKGKK